MLPYIEFFFEPRCISWLGFSSCEPDQFADWMAILTWPTDISLNIFNVHSNRSPIAGEIIEKTYIQGKFFNAAFDKASENNERNSLIIKAKNGHLVCCVQIAGLIARRILCYAKEGDYLRQGQRYGFIRFGSRLDLYLPLTAVPKVAIGDKVTAGETLVALLDG